MTLTCGRSLWLGPEFLTLEHWSNAVEQAKVAAHNMLTSQGRRRPDLHVPTFWSYQFGVSIKSMEVPPIGEDLVVAQGSADERRFVALYGHRGAPWRRSRSTRASGSTCFGLRRVYLFAVIDFTLGSALCGMAFTLKMLIAFRVFQAIGGGLLPVLAQTIVFRMVPREKIGMAMSPYGLGLVVAPAIGPTLGGWLVEDVDWRLIFYINVPPLGRPSAAARPCWWGPSRPPMPPAAAR